MKRVVGVEVPEEIAVILERDPLLKKMVEERLVSEVKEYFFRVFVLDELLKGSKLTEADVKSLDEEVKRGIWEKYKRELGL